MHGPGKSRNRKRQNFKISRCQNLPVPREGVLRNDLVSLGSYVAVRSDEKSLQPYWLYEVLETHTDTFLGVYLEPVKGNGLKY